MSKLKIVVEKGHEYQATAESIYRKDSFFRDVYQMAKECIGEILYVGKNFEDLYDSKKSRSDAELNADLMGYSNNLIAFCANRGHGKTSAMLSCADALKKMREDIGVDKNYYTKEEFWRGTDAENYHYEVIESIDPTMMENGDSILKVILSRMFSHFQETWEEMYNNRRYGDVLKDLELSRNKLARVFQKCYHSIQVLKNEKKCGEDDELEQIMELGDSSNMRGMLYRLVCEYLDFVCAGKNSYLIIQIDDADLNIEKAYNIIEDIRKYLVMPKVIVLLAVNMTQLESTVEQYFISQYQVSIKNEGMVDVEQCHEIAERYIDKVIPGRRQIYLPDLSKVLSDGYDSITVSYEKTSKNGEKEYLLGVPAENKQNNLRDEKYRYQDQLLHFLRKRTGLILMDSKTFTHNLLPGNMRELSHFLVYFGDMEELSVNYEDLIDIFARKKNNYKTSLVLWKKNLQKFQHYLVDLWSAVNLREEGRGFLKSLAREPVDNKNRHVLKFLPDYYGHEREAVGIVRGVSTQKAMDYRQQFIEECEKRGVYLTDESGVCEHASYADVYAALGVLGELPGWNRQYKFVYAVRLYYSIQLHLLLLEQIESGIEGKGESGRENGNNSLVAFIEDVLYRRNDDRLPQNLPYQRFCLDEEKLNKYIKCVTSYGSQEERSWIEHFCRREIKGVRTYQTVLKTTEAGGEERTLVFNIFYPLLYELDMLGGENETARKSYIKDNDMQSYMLTAFIVLLNVDVQYMILRKIKEYEKKAREQSMLLSGYISDFYRMSGIKDVLLEACEENRKQKRAVERFIERYGDENSYKDWLLAVQLSCSNMSEMTKKYCEEACEDLKKLKQKLKELVNYDDDTKSIEELKEKWKKGEKGANIKELATCISEIDTKKLKLKSLIEMLRQEHKMESNTESSEDKKEDKRTLKEIKEEVEKVEQLLREYCENVK